MHLIISDSERKYSEKFIYFLVNELIKELLKNLNYRQLKRLDNYVNSHKIFNIPNLNFYNVICKSLNIFRFDAVKDGYVIYLDPNERYLKTEVSILQLIKFMTYGTQTIKGYPIFLSVFNNIESNIDTYYQYYLNKKGVF